MKIVIGADHAGVAYKAEIIKWLETNQHEVINVGADTEQSVDYPDYAHAAAVKVVENNTIGILLCGSANGVVITANKHAGVRAALCWQKEIAILSRQHNNANIICLPARFISLHQAIDMVDVFLKTDFEGGRHANRVNKIDC
jgi:ribose 5-phosphate isomerase B